MKSEGRGRPGIRGLALAASLCAACGDSSESVLVLAREEQLDRQIEGLRGLVARAKSGGLAPLDGVVIAVSEGLVRDLLDLGLPREIALPDDGLRVRLEAAEVAFRDGHGTVRLEGGAEWTKVPGLAGTVVSARLTVHGRIERLAVDARAGRLAGSVVPVGFEIRRLEVGEDLPRTRRLAGTLARALEEELPRLAVPLAIPVAVEHRLDLRAIESGPFHVRGASVPLRLVVRDVSAHGGRLWVVVGIEPGRWTVPAEEPGR
jgi:hypothetical protein